MGAKRLAKTHSPKPRFPITSKVTSKQRRQTPVKNNYNRKDNGQIFRAETAKISAIRKKSNLNFKTGNNVNNVNCKIAFLIKSYSSIVYFLSAPVKGISDRPRFKM